MVLGCSGIMEGGVSSRIYKVHDPYPWMSRRDALGVSDKTAPVNAPHRVKKLYSQTMPPPLLRASRSPSRQPLPPFHIHIPPQLLRRPRRRPLLVTPLLILILNMVHLGLRLPPPHRRHAIHLILWRRRRGPRTGRRRRYGFRGQPGVRVGFLGLGPEGCCHRRAFLA